MVDWIGAREQASMDRFVLLDAQDWMNNAQLDDLWTKITRASRPGARVLFRTAAEQSLLTGRLDDAILGKWRYLEEISADCTRRDRSSIYGGVHVYELA
jgi:S-adenosylmethionine-diacylglycerol 3-amino-3-carboxypropyl transferase